MALTLYGAAPWIASGAYLALALGSRTVPARHWPWATWVTWLVLALGLLAHAVSLADSWIINEHLRFGFAHALSWMAWLSLVLSGLGQLSQRTPDAIKPRLSLPLLLLASLTSLLPSLFPGVPLVSEPTGLLRAHLLFGVLAYSCFCLAAAQALVMQAQEKALHQGVGRLLAPPDGISLLARELTLFRILVLVELLLTATLVSGMVVGHAEGRAWFSLDHKTVFTWLTWLLGGVFLLGHVHWGWRGQTAARFTLLGFGFLLLSYVGSRFVTEVLLGRVG